MRLGPFIQRLLPESTGIVCLKVTGLVPGRRVSAWGSSAIHHCGSGAGARSQLPRRWPTERGSGTAPPGPARRRCQES